jgi:hypothetical protein
MNKQLEIFEPIHGLNSDIPFLNYKTSIGVISSTIKHCVFTPELTLGGGLHDNTMWVSYNATDYLKCRHQHGRLNGVFLSPIYDKGSSARRMVYVLTDMTTIGVGTTWDSQIPLTLWGANLLTNGDFANWTANEPDNWTEADSEADEEVGGQAGSGCKITTSADLGRITQDIAVTAGYWYRLDGYYKNDAGSTFFIATYDITNSKFIDPEIGYPEESATATWTAFSHLFRAPAGCATIRLFVGGRSNGDVVYVDSLVVKRIIEVFSTTWDDIGISSTSWGDIFDVSAAPQVSIRLYYGDSSPPTSYVDNMEILSTIVKARYYRVRISITDPTSEIYAYIMHYILEFCT